MGGLNSGYPNLFMRISKYSGGGTTIYYRIYPQIQDVLANVWGTLGTVMLLVGFIALPYSSYKMQQTMVKSLYKVKVPVKESVKIYHDNEEPAKDIENLKPLPNFPKVQRTWLGLFRSDPRAKAISQAYEKIEKDVDVVTIIKLRRELDLLKQVVLTQDQRRVFDNIEFSKIVVNNDDKAEIIDLSENFKGNRAALRVGLKYLERPVATEKILELYKKTE